MTDHETWLEGCKRYLWPLLICVSCIARCEFGILPIRVNLGLDFDQVKSLLTKCMTLELSRLMYWSKRQSRLVWWSLISQWYPLWVWCVANLVHCNKYLDLKFYTARRGVVKKRERGGRTSGQAFQMRKGEFQREFNICSPCKVYLWEV